MNSWIATVILQTRKALSEDCNNKRMNYLEKIIEEIATKTEGNGIILFPAGWLNTGENEPKTIYTEIEMRILKKLEKLTNKELIIVLGIDGRVLEKQKRDQIAIAVNKKGIIAIARKFYPTKNEKAFLIKAKNPDENEEGKPRVFEFENKRYFMGVCYDSFGSKKMKKPAGINIFLNLVHGFQPKGNFGSGEVYFVKHGFAGSSQAWECQSYGAAVFFDRKISKFPSGVLWNKGKTSTKNWKYNDNTIKPKNTFEIRLSEQTTNELNELAQIRVFTIE